MRIREQRSAAGRRIWQNQRMDHIAGAVLGIVLLLASIACFPIAFALQSTNAVFLPVFFGLGVLLLSAALPVPIFLLDRLDGRG